MASEQVIVHDFSAFSERHKQRIIREEAQSLLRRFGKDANIIAESIVKKLNQIDYSSLLIENNILKSNIADAIVRISDKSLAAATLTRGLSDTEATAITNISRGVRRRALEKYECSTIEVYFISYFLYSLSIVLK